MILCPESLEASTSAESDLARCGTVPLTLVTSTGTESDMSTCLTVTLPSDHRVPTGFGKFGKVLENGNSFSRPWKSYGKFRLSLGLWKRYGKSENGLKIKK